MPMSTKRPAGGKSPKELAAPLLKAARAGDVTQVTELLAEGAKPDQRVPGEPTLLIAAATLGHIEVVRALLAGGADVNFKHGGKTGTTALLEAIRHDQFEVACELVEAGAESAHDWSGEGHNIAYEAIAKCNKMHREASAPTGPDLIGIIYKGEGIAARAKAARLLPSSVKLVEKILKAGGKPGRPCLPDAAANGNLPVVRRLLAHGADINEGGKYGGTAFSRAVGQCQIETAEALLKAGADPNAGETLTGPPFHAAVVAGKTELVKAVVASGKNLNFRATVTLNEPMEKASSEPNERPRYALNLGDDCVELAKAYDSTPLIAAVRAGHAEIVRILAEGGTDLEAVDRDGFTALAWALKRNRADLAAILRCGGAKEMNSLAGSPLNVLFEACQTGDLEKAQTAITAGADVNAARETTREMFTPLIVAVRNGHTGIVNHVLNSGANPNLGGREEMFLIVSPLILAARQGHVDIVMSLLKASAGTDHAGRDLLNLREKGDSAIHEAARNGHARVVEVLLQACANPRERSEWSGSVLSAAIESGNLATVKVALATGVKPNAKKLRELLAEAMASEHWDIVRELYAMFGVPAGSQKK